MSAARRKGKWVGGIPVLGYDVAVDGGKLVVNHEEARQVRAIFNSYMRHRALPPVLSMIQQQQWTTKRWTTRGGRLCPGRPFTSHDVVRLLSNPIYAGKIRCREEFFGGEHEAIIDEETWQGARNLLNFETCSARAKRVPAQAQLDPIAAGQQQTESVTSRLPRLTRLLALAMKFDELIQQREVKDYAELARLGHVSRGRVTQIMNLLNLAPDVQEQILFSAPGASNKKSKRETSIRTLCAEVIWSRQRELWKKSSGPNDS